MVVKKGAVAAAAAMAGLLVVAAPAGAGTPHPSSHQKAEARRVAQLTKANRRLRTQLRNMTILRNDAKAALATANGQLGTLRSQNSALQSQSAALQSQNASLQAQVASLTKARDAALTQVAALQAQIAAIPEPLAVAVEQVRREVAYAEHVGGLPYAHGRLVAQAAM